LLLAAAVFSLIAGRNWAQNNEMNVQFHGFTDARGVTVLSPTVDLTQDYTERTNLRINYGLDTISAASDSCVRCHNDGVNSHRQVFGLSATRKYNDVKLTIGGAYSKENFYRATTGLASVSRDLANGNTTVAGGFSFSLNQPVLHPMPESENQYQSNGFVSVTQTLTKSTIAQAGYEIEHVSGYQNNPYLRADVNGVLVLGQVPDLRTRQTLSARLRQALPASTYLEADYRRYTDDWEVKSNAVSVGLSHYFRPEFLLALAYRRYDQTGACFRRRIMESPVLHGDLPEPFASNNYTGESRSRPRPRGGCCRRAQPSGAMTLPRPTTDSAAVVSTGLECR
jgi:hypothetical protein